MRAAESEPKPPASRHDNRAGVELAAATAHNALRSASASMIVYVNHVNHEEVMINDGICQGSGGAPDGGATPGAKEEHTQVRHTSLQPTSLLEIE